ncbi:hypothetical protein CEXT_436861 [Caerostris extrusa]|uniref:Uncharacterized protein n=1 Tax=Caerostris extrusa TaxID=172846 RepID=A0AAV4XFX2_CAEEX|nr:hypothetical protein CEXT_436861 [Caerostris extrusa]
MSKNTGQKAPWSPKSNESVPNFYRRLISLDARRHSGKGQGRWKNQFFPSTPVHANEQEEHRAEGSLVSLKSNESVPNCYRHIVSLDAKTTQWKVHANEQQEHRAKGSLVSLKSNESVPNCYRRIVSLDARRRSEKVCL